MAGSHSPNRQRSGFRTTSVLRYLADGQPCAITMLTCRECLSGIQTAAQFGGDGQWSCSWDRNTVFAAFSIAAETCFFCHVVICGLRSRAPSDDSPNCGVALRYVFRQCDEDIDVAWLSITISDSQNSFKAVFLVADTRHEDTLFSIIRGFSTGSPEALRFLKNQLDLCDQTHESCRSIINREMWYPTRLIELVGDGARLISTKDTKPSGPYASLSHSWGKDEMFRCTEDTMRDLMKGIPMHELRTTFKEAFCTARFLGIHYIWIDSLCIIQDSAEDWSREVQTMMKVYQRARINLAATTSTGGSTSLFTNRDPEKMVSDPFPIDNGILHGTFRAVEAVLDRGAWESSIEEAPLNRRAWVMQERLLSPRVAHFRAGEIVWDCSESTASELITSGKLAHPLVVTMWIGRKRDSLVLRLPDDKKKGIGQWSAIVNAYSRCGLTKKYDKFIAISGVAEFLHQNFEDEYHCGLWRLDMELQLCWCLADYDGKKIDSYDIAPSWSWASIDGPVEIPQPHLYEGYTVKLFMKVTKVTSLREYCDEGRERWGGSVQMRCFLNAATMEGVFTEPRLLGSGMEHVTRVKLDTPDVFNHDGFFVIPVFDVQDPMIAGKSRYSEVTGLLLRLVDAASGAYARCGIVHLFASTEKTTGEFPITWLRLFSATGKGHLPSQAFDIQSGHLIKLV